MKIIDLQPASGFAGEAKVLARFLLQLTPDVKLCGLRLDPANDNFDARSCVAWVKARMA